MASFPEISRRSRAAFCVLLASGSLAAQQAAPRSVGGGGAPAAPEKTIELSPFVVEAEEDNGYLATSTLAGTRLRSNLRDLGSAISVVTEQFMKDTNSTNVEDLLVYTANTEIGGLAGNFSGIDLRQGATVDETGNFTRQNTNNRVRGLGGADNTREYSLTDIPSDSYNVGRWDIQRGPNSILFGLGKAAGVINAGLNQASFRNFGKFENRVGSYGSVRNTIDFNRVLRDQELAVRISGLLSDTRYRQDPTFEDDKRVYAAIRYDPKFLSRNGMKTSLRANVEHGSIMGMRPRTLPPIDRLSAWFGTTPFEAAANPNIGKPAVTYPAMNRALYDNWLATNRAFWANRNWNYGTDPRPAANVWNPISASSMLPSAQQWRNPANRESTSRTFVSGWELNPAYVPFIAEVFTAGVNGFSQGDGSSSVTRAQYANAGPTLSYGLNNGNTFNTTFTPLGFFPAGNVGAFRYTQYLAISAPWLMYREMQIPFGGLYRDPSLTDRGAFDFIEQNLDGDTRRNWREFDAINLTLDQTFFNNRAGLSFTFDRQDYEDGSHSIFNDRTQTVTVDINATLPATNLPNPNAGRAVMMGDGNYFTRVTDREEIRGTAFTELRATDFLPKSWLTRVLGRHVLTGFASENTYDQDNRSYRRFMLDPNDLKDMGLRLGVSADPTAYRTVMYLTEESLTNATKYPSLSSLNLSGPTQWTAPKTVALEYFDSRWNRPTDPNAPGYVDPSAPWLDPWGLNPSAFPAPVSNSSQRNNPANYVGWRTREVRLLDATNDEDRPRMNTGNLNLSRSKIESRALVWQGFLFDGTIVPTFGYRKDISKAYSFAANRAGIPGLNGIYRPTDIINPNTGAVAYRANPLGIRSEDGFVIPDSPNIVLPVTPDNTLETINRSWSVVGHAPEFVRRRLPWGTALSLSYNESSNFDPGAAGRRNMWNQPIDPPGGKTRDVGLLVSMLDNRVNFRVVKYTASITGNSLGFPSQWHQIEGRSWVAAKKVLDGIKAAETTDYLHNPLPGVTPYTSQFNTPTYLYGTIDPSNTNRILYASQAEKDALLKRGREMATMIVNGLPAELAAAWNIDTASEQWRTVTDIGGLPAGATSIQDRSASGWEYEFTIMPTRRWRITGNVSTTEAGQNNSFSDIKDYAFERNEYWTGPAGNFYYANPGRETSAYRDDWTLNVMGAITSRLLADGQSVQESVRRRYNLVTSYDFGSGRLKGFKVGGAYRWEDKAAIGYKYKYVRVTSGTRVADFEVPDLEQPIYGEELRNLDLWLGYERKISDKVRWNIQINLRNVGDSATLVPISVQPDGTVAQYRIKDGMSWAVTNSFAF